MAIRPLRSIHRSVEKWNSPKSVCRFLNIGGFLAQEIPPYRENGMRGQGFAVTNFRRIHDPAYPHPPGVLLMGISFLGFVLDSVLPVVLQCPHKANGQRERRMENTTTEQGFVTLAEADLEHATIRLQKDTEAEVHAATYFVTIEEYGLPTVSERQTFDHALALFGQAVRFEELER